MAQPRTGVLAAIRCEDDQRQIHTLACQMVQERQADVITPVQIFAYQHQRLSSRVAYEEMGEGREEPAFVGLGIKHWIGGQIGRQWHNAWEQLFQLMHNRVSDGTSLLRSLTDELGMQKIDK